MLAAPINGIDSTNFTLLIAASLAAVVAAKLRNLPVAVVVGLLMGVATSLIQRYLPSDSQWTTGLIDAIPFIVVALFLIYSLFRRGRIGETEGWGGALDRAITPQGESKLAGSTSERGGDGIARLRREVCAAPCCSSAPWRSCPCSSAATGSDSSPRPWPLASSPCPGPSSRAKGACSGSARSPSQASGRSPRAQLANNHGWPVLAAAVMGGLIAGAMGALVGFLSIRLGDLYVALVTLTFGLLMENLVFTLPSFVNQGIGLTLNRPGFASTDLSYTYLCLVVFVIIALFIVNFRRSTTGLALNAARWSEAGARTSGISVVQMKVIAGSLAALIAGIGGALYAMAQTTFQPSEFATFAGVVWLAVLVTIGVRSTAAALIAGLTLVLPQCPLLLSTYRRPRGSRTRSDRVRARRDLRGQVPRRRTGRAESPAPDPSPAVQAVPSGR